MTMQRIWGPAPVYSGTTPGTPNEYDTLPQHLGTETSYLSFVIRVLGRSHADMKVGLKLRDGPNADVLRTHSTPIASTTLSTPPSLLSGDATTSTPLLPVIQPVILADIASGSTERWAMVEVWQLSKQI